MIDRWIQTHLETRGLWNADGVSRAVRARQCRKCHKLVLTALDSDMCAGVAIVDPTPLSPLGEAAALILGRRTYFLWPRLDRLELDLRYDGAIAGRPAGAGRYDVVGTHECGTGPLPSIKTFHTTTPVGPNGEPPF